MKPVAPLAIRTLAAPVDAPRDDVFRFLADVENLPRWAPEFCERLQLSRGQWLAWTVEGELFIEIDAHDRSGAVDLRWGDGQSCERLLPLRVVALPGGQALVSAVFYQTPERSELAFERECELLGAALHGLGDCVRRDLAAWRRLAV